MKKKIWAPAALDGGVYRIKAYAEFVWRDVSLFVTRPLGKKRGFTVTARNGMRFYSVERSSIQGAVAACKLYVEGIMHQHDATPEGKPFLEVLRDAGEGSSLLTDEQIMALPEWKPEVVSTVKDFVTAVVRETLGAGDFALIAPLLAKVVAKKGVAAGRLHRKPPSNTEERALWAALQPNYFKVKDGSIAALIAVSRSDLGQVISRLHKINWPVSFDYDADHLSKMGAFP